MLFHATLVLETQYESISARGTLYTLGYTEQDADQILRVLHSEGFNYCLDPMFPSRDSSKDDDTMIHTPIGACYWGPDQLISRIQCCDIARYRPTRKQKRS
jgi:hypothetical protein